MSPEFDISILLPTRGRADMLERSLESLIRLSGNLKKIQFLFGFDEDDEVGLKHFGEKIQPWFDSAEIEYTALSFKPYGYERLHEYVNELARTSDGRWMVFWNDDAVMQTQDWDLEIMKWDGQFRLLAFHTHNDHPYSIFPIVPQDWLKALGHLSHHQLNDAWLSQQAYLLDIYERIPVWVDHDRYDLTGNNQDDTFKKRVIFEGNPSDPRDFHSVQNNELRHTECAKLAQYLEKERGMSMKFFADVFRGTQDPWVKLKENDVNNQMKQFQNPHGTKVA